MLQRILKSPGCRKIPVIVQNTDDVVCSATNFTSERCVTSRVKYINTCSIQTSMYTYIYVGGNILLFTVHVLLLNLLKNLLGFFKALRIHTSLNNNYIYIILNCRMCPIFQVSNVSGENLDLLKMFLNLLSTRLKSETTAPAEFQIDDTFSVPVCINNKNLIQCKSCKLNLIFIAVSAKEKILQVLML